MAQLAICSFLFGAVFGLRFRVLVLFPATIALALATIPVALIAQVGVLIALEGFAVCALALHGGYIFGSFAQFSIAAARASRVLERPLKTAR